MSEVALLTAKGLGVRLAGRVVLKDVSLALSPGRLVALVGPNGAGKTTLLRALAGLIPSEGEIEIGGQALSSLPLRERAKRFGYLPQGHGLDIGLRIGDGGLRHHVVHRKRLGRQRRGAPAKARRQRDLGVEFVAQRVTDQLVHRAGKIAAAIEQAISGRDLVGP